ncbi:hypothetical protein [Roseobacter litoralis]|uniref:hypothetical protein n=1 Tax=Roseobacter litoralis TaxID=42443 RepID=UPI002495752B|nr:hypothetical protein [Roseobacter litoralis]
MLILAICMASGASGEESCVEPFRPELEYLSDGGLSPEEIREAYRDYFSGVEDYLNCLNCSSARVRQEATAAAQEFSRVLDQYPASPGAAVEPEPVPRFDMSETGRLFLDHRAGWLR